MHTASSKDTNELLKDSLPDMSRISMHVCCHETEHCSATLRLPAVHISTDDKQQQPWFLKLRYLTCNGENVSLDHRSCGAHARAHGLQTEQHLVSIAQDERDESSPFLNY
jgi:hypothetical protein